MHWESKSAQDTFFLGEKMAQYAAAGDVVALSGDLGAGKTVFAKGFAKGLGINDAVNSPTFTILQIYEGGRLPFYHFDVYRIEDIEEMEEVGLDEYLFGKGVCLIEWAEKIKELLPKDTIYVTLTADFRTDPNLRIIEINRQEEKF